VVRAAVGLYTADPLLDGAVMVEQKRRARDSFHRSTCINYLKDNAANERMQLEKRMGRTMGLEPTTSKTTTWRSTN
jgi:hypothetical protein